MKSSSGTFSTSRTFLDFFPPPRFLAMSTSGIDISDEMIRIFDLKKNSKGYHINKFGEAPIPVGVIEGGYIKDKSALIKILSSMRDQYKFKFVKASVPEEKAYIFKTTIPIMDEGDIRSALQFKVEENVPMALADAVFDYRLIKRDEKARHIDITMSVIHKKVVSSYLEVFHGAGIMPLEFKIESQGMASCVIPKDDLCTYVIVNIRESKTTLAIVSNRLVQFTTSLTLGGKSINESIQKAFSVNKEEAEKIRAGEGSKEQGKVFESLANSSSVLRDEIQKIYLYWQNTADENSPETRQIQKVILCGSDALLGIQEYLERSLKINVEVANVWTNILSPEETVPPLPLRESLNYAIAIGLALPHD